MSARPKSSHPSADRRKHTATNSAKSQKTASNSASTYGDENFELLEYEWPDLPPMFQIKDAMSRRKISSGISYLLPPDKPKISIENTYRTDLRTMFQSPFTENLYRNNDSHVKQQLKFNFTPNTPPPRFKVRQKSARKKDIALNDSSEKIRQSYCKSAPPKLQKTLQTKLRSNLFLPIPVKVPEEAQKLKAEVEEMLLEVEDADDFNPDTDESIPSENTHEKHPKKTSRRHSENVKDNNHIIEKLKAHKTILITDESTSEHSVPSLRRSSISNSITKTPKKAPLIRRKSEYKMVHFGDEEEVSYNPIRKTKNFKNYDEVKNIAGPEKLPIPKDFKSPYLNDGQNDRIWDWLNYDQKLTSFDYFIDLCS
ncbi:unnamed protein product [Owenia fusiformis]|uniref:Uncharacterized protein n=1 Tax=Owenia fusiformis TaxID=6347 RepID=A0A8J1T4Y0_OWEFU|nr:unnamed protein product [Owenia fusiformis]